MTLNTMMYSYVLKEKDLKCESINDYRDDDYPLKVIEEQPVVNDTMYSTIAEPIPTNPMYIISHIFDEIPEQLYATDCVGYVDKNGNPSTDEVSIKYLTKCEHVNIDAELEYYDENGNINYMDYDD